MGSSNLIELFPEKKYLQQLTLGINDAVEHSFAVAKMRNITTAEIKRRFDICVKWAVTLRGEVKPGWTTKRIVDALPNILAAELSGKGWQPDSRLCWIPTDG
jgi:hypothetical protein